jgi:Legionella pneumophila major outer membrane protein precursor
MLSLKKTAVAVLALSSSVAFAGTMGCTPGSVTVPCEMTAWDFGIAALYYEPAYDSGGTYNQLFQYHQNGNNEAFWMNDYDPDWGWGFKLTGSYHFDTGNDLTVDWYHYDQTTNQAWQFNDFGGRNDNFWLYLDNKVRWDAVNIEYGQHMDAGMSNDLRVHGGVTIVSLKNSPNAWIRDFGGGVGSGQHVFIYNEAKYNGVGVRGGVDFSRDFQNGLKGYVKTAVGLTTGKAKFHTWVRGTGFAAPGATNTFFIHGEHNKVVGQLEGSIGGTYTMPMSNGNVIFDIGWNFINYFNAMHGFSFAAGTGAFAPSIVESDQGFQGPSFGVKWIGNV